MTAEGPERRGGGGHAVIHSGDESLLNSSQFFFLLSNVNPAQDWATNAAANPQKMSKGFIVDNVPVYTR